MRKLTPEEVRHVAGLIKTDIKEDEIPWYQEQLGKVLEYLEVFDELDIENVEQTGQITGLKNIFREDEVKKSFTHEEVFLNRKDTNGYFEIVKVL